MADTQDPVNKSQLSPERRKAIVDALAQRGVQSKCPMCGNPNFILADGYTNTAIQAAYTGLVIGGPSVPAAVIICSKCGFISQHALGVLGLLEIPAKEPEKK